ncbi:MAG: hypothetical protein JSW39_22770 [Desulfobacterales bacterium]|nr:MAG: hypothetical protein JSW39_22770 [Desulfobacterales bacterium]
MPTAELKSLNLAEVIRQQGIELQQRGNRHFALCPFHAEKTPSFMVFPDNRFHCFGCGAHGDSIDFIRQLHGCSFQEALRHLGIERGPVSFKTRMEAQKQNHRKLLVEQFRRWETDAAWTFSTLIRAAHKAMRNLTPEQVGEYGSIYFLLEYWEYCHDILCFGTDEDKFYLYKQCRENGMKLIERHSLFRPDFDYKGWLKEVNANNNGRI